MNPDAFTHLDRFAFDFTEEQRLIRQTALDYGRKRLADGAAERDKTRRYPIELIRELGEMGLLAMRVPERWGGTEADNVSYALALEAIAEADASVAAILASSNLVAAILSAHGTDRQREQWLRPYAAGELGPAAFALTEPQAGSDASALRTQAVRDGDDYVLDGSKMWITSGSHAGVFLVFAKTDPDAGAEGIGAFLLGRDAPGFEIGKDEPKMGLRSSGTVALHFDGCRVPATQMIGPQGGGYRVALEALGPGRVGIAAQAVGMAEAAFREGATYAAERTAFGKRVVDFQNSQFVLVDSRVDLDAAWLLILRAAKRLDAGERQPMETSMAKLFATEACGRVVDRMLQLHGGYGYSEEYTIERLYRDARVTRIYEGTNEIQRLVAARQILRALG